MLVCCLSTSVCHFGFSYDVVDNFASMSAGKPDSCGLNGVVHPDDSLTEMLHVTVFLYQSDFFYIFLHIFLTHSNSFSG